MRSLSLPLLALAAFTSTAGAAPPEPGGRVPPVGHLCPQGERSALSELGCEVGRQLGLTEDTLLAAAPLTADVPVDRPGHLVERLVRVVGGSLGSTLKLHTTPVSLGEARRLATRTGRLLFLTAELRGGRLHVTADEYVQARAFWDRVKSPEAGPLRHAHAERAADGEVRSFLPRPPLLVTQRDSAPLPDRPALALACGSFEPNGGDQLLLVGRRRVTAARLRAGELERLAEREWEELSPIAPAPLRAPLASAQLRGPWLEVGTSDRTHAVRLTNSLEVVARAARALPRPGGGCAPIGPVGAEAAWVSCFDKGPSRERETSEQGGPFDALARAQLVRPDGSASSVTAYRPNAGDAAWIVDDAGRRAPLPDVGAQLALADLDGDGRVEVISSRAVLDPEGDGLRVETWNEDGSLTERYRIALPDIQAIAVCPWQGSGPSPIAVAAKDRVWVLR